MSEIHLRQIKNKLEQDFEGGIDVSDLAGKSESDIASARRSRALAALALAQRLAMAPSAAGAAVTDGFDDNGIDAIGTSDDGTLVVVVQAKWDSSGNGSPALGDLQKFVQGFRDLVNGRFERFNQRVVSRQASITAALDNTDVRFELVVVHSGTAPLSEPGKRVFEDLLGQINDVSDIASVTLLSQAEIHAFVRSGAIGQPPDLTVTLHEWGRLDRPYDAIYGQVAVTEVAAWWTAHSTVLFGDNLRMFLPDSMVNEAIALTLLEHPDHFWYFNNGITVLCQRISQAARGSTDRRSGTFEIERASVVNGAQTVGAIGAASARDEPNLGEAWVSVRFISLEGAPEGLASDITRATNTQNRVLPRDFVALDPEQERLRTDLRLDGKTYAIKSGEPDPSPESGCTVLDATVALACAYSVDLAVQAKREIGRLWDDVGRPPYTELFSASTTATRVWRCVEVMRRVEAELATQRATLEGRDRLTAVHGNRLITRLVFEALGHAAINDPQLDLNTTLARIPGLVAGLLGKVAAIVTADYPQNYPASIFKNATKCRDIAGKAAPTTSPDPKAAA
jgi:hypothetical protein